MSGEKFILHQLQSIDVAVSYSLGFLSTWDRKDVLSKVVLTTTQCRVWEILNASWDTGVRPFEHRTYLSHFTSIALAMVLAVVLTIGIAIRVAIGATSRLPSIAARSVGLAAALIVATAPRGLSVVAMAIEVAHRRPFGPAPKIVLSHFGWYS